MLRSPFRRVAGPFRFTEGPVWDGEHVLFTDIPTNRIMEFDPPTGSCRIRRADTGGANGLALDHAGRLLACEGDARRLVRHENDGRITTLADGYGGRRLNSPNDVVIDSAGCVWFTDPRYGDRGDMELDHESVFRLDMADDGPQELVRLTYDTVRPNGLALSPDEGTLYVAESPRAPDGVRELRRYVVRPDGTLGAMEVLRDFGPHRGIDGMLTTADGCIVAACGWRQSGEGSRVAIFDPSGELIRQYAMPVEPTNVCVAGSDMTDLYVTAYDGGLWHTTLER